jgi:eukaryotic-like serine/threonine-protein kinase
MKRYQALIGRGVLGRSVWGLSVLGLSVIALAACSSTTTSSQPPTSPPTSPSATISQPSLAQGSTSATVTASPPPSTAASSTAASSTGAPTGDVAVCVTPVVTCKGELKTEPGEIYVSGDGSAFITGLTWTGWGLSSATGSGTLKIDNCSPNCAQGSFTDYQVTVILSKLTGYGGGAAYATMMVDAPGSPFGLRVYHHLTPSPVADPP